MARNTSVTLGDHLGELVLEKINVECFQSVIEVVRAGLRKLEGDEIKLQVLKYTLKARKSSPLIDNFDSATFIGELN